MIYFVNTIFISFLLRTGALLALCIGISSTVLRADIVQDYLDLNPEVSVFSLKVGPITETCVATACATYSSVKLEVPKYIHSNQR